MFLTIKKLTRKTFPGSLYHYTLSLICLDMEAECSYWAKCKRLTTLWSAVICLVSPLKKVTLTVSPSPDTSFLVPLGKVIRRSPPARTFSIWKDHDQVLSAVYLSITPKKLTDTNMRLFWYSYYLQYSSLTFFLALVVQNNIWISISKNIINIYVIITSSTFTMALYLGDINKYFVLITYSEKYYIPT